MNSKINNGVNIGIWENNILITKQNYGYADIKKQTHMEWNMHVRIGSISKMFTTTIILKLLSENQISLDDLVSKYIQNIDGILRSALNDTDFSDLFMAF